MLLEPFKACWMVSCLGSGVLNHGLRLRETPPFFAKILLAHQHFRNGIKEKAQNHSDQRTILQAFPYRRRESDPYSISKGILQVPRICNSPQRNFSLQSPAALCGLREAGNAECEKGISPQPHCYSQSGGINILLKSAAFYSLWFPYFVKKNRLFSHYSLLPPCSLGVHPDSARPAGVHVDVSSVCEGTPDAAPLSKVSIGGLLS